MLTVFFATVYWTNQVAALGTAQIAASTVTGLLFVGTIGTGGMLSAGTPVSAAVLTLHQIMPFLTVMSSAAALYLVSGR